MASPCLWAVLAIVCLHPWPTALSGTPQDPEASPGDARWELRVVDSESGVPLGGVLVSFPGLGETRVTGSLGVAPVPPGTGDSVRVVATRVGYRAVDTVVVPPAGETRIDLPLVRSAIALATLTVEAERAGANSRELARQMFEREVAVGAVGMTRAGVRAVPAVGEPDVFRSLQSVSGVTSINDFGAEMFVRGGDADQVAVLVDGAPVFGPYHMFGMIGVFNPDAIESTELYKGSIPARYGGSLSGVVAARHGTGIADRASFIGGLSALGLRTALNGALPGAHGRWLLAVRNASVDVARLPVPYSFHDVNAAVHLYPSEEHRLGVSLLASNDDFAWDFLELVEFGKSIRSDWTNLVSSVTWSWVRGNRITSDVSAYLSRYEANLAAAPEISALVTRNRISVQGVRAQITVRGDVTGLRSGLVLEGGPVNLSGTGTGAYMDGDASGSFLYASAFAELEHWIGALRLAPGIRAGTERISSRVFAEPRLSARLHLGAFAVSGSLDRSFQFLSVLRDDRHLAPGAPMWFLRGEDQPVSAADGMSVAVDYWRGRTWTAAVTGWTRRFSGIPSWHPESSRDLSALEYHDGSAAGWEVAVEKHAGLLRGWLSYQQAWVSFRDGQAREYWPRWDRRHELDATVSLEDLGGLSLSLRATVASGAPFWFPVGRLYGMAYDPRGQISNENTPNNPIVGLGQREDSFVILSDVQGRLPYYGRADLSARYAFSWGDLTIVPFLSVPNFTVRENVLTYRPAAETRGGKYLVRERQFPPFPFIGVDFRY
ncbi:MAG: TonB-dependent receptor plug domain-containing protein [Gemmatimonadota bacterium]|nr:TonB-dependent receptor plug domain-containing protein [Gemmatimonadota bacterium]